MLNWTTLFLNRTTLFIFGSNLYLEATSLSKMDAGFHLTEVYKSVNDSMDIPLKKCLPSS